MNAFVLTLSLICGIMFYGNGLPYRDILSKYQNRDDYYEDYYLRKIPKLKTSPEKVREFLLNHLSWFPVDDLEDERHSSGSNRYQNRRSYSEWNLALESSHDHTTHKAHNYSKMKDKLKHKLKNFTECHHIPTNWTSIKSQSSKSMHKVQDYIKHKHFKDVLKNVTHPLRYRGPHEGNHSKCGLPGDKYLGPSVRIHPKGSHVKVIKTTTGNPFPNLPNIPGLENLPNIPNMPNLPKTPELPESSNPSIPSVPPEPGNPPVPPESGNPPVPPESDNPPVPPEPGNPPVPPEPGNPPVPPESGNPPVPPESGNPPLPSEPANPPPPSEPGNPPAPPNPSNPNPPPPDPSVPNPPISSGRHSLHSGTPVKPSVLRTGFSYPRKFKVIIDLSSPDKTSKIGRHVNNKSYLASVEGDSPNSTNVLETAGEMASDLAGRVTSLWHCVLGSHHVPDTRDVKFYLYTRRNVIRPELLKVNYDLIRKKVKANSKHVDLKCYDLPPKDIGKFERISDENREIIRSNFLNIRAPTKILIHGYTGSYKDSRMAKIKDAYLNSGRYNVIQVDWEMLAAPPCYIRVTHHSKFVGETIAQFLDGLHLVGLNMSLIHLVGFSLGAQVAGFAGNNATTVPVCRITGLDPALPLFLHTEPSGHLDRLDAKFVDVIHTCGGILAMLDPLGHVDFYPNGGTRQPGCEFSNLKCSHSRAPQYFAESIISNKKFKGQLCLTWEEYVSGDCNNVTDISFMGEPCSRRSVFGKYYLLTKSKEPFVV